jgi:hypothetical protein
VIWLYVSTWSPALDCFAAQMRIIWHIGAPEANRFAEHRHRNIACDVISLAM